MKFFGCDTDESKLSFLKVLLVYEKLEDILKETSIEQVKEFFSLNNKGDTSLNT